MDSIDTDWDDLKKTYDEQSIKGIKLLKHYMLDYEEFEKTELFKNELPYILVDQLKDDIRYISSIVYDPTEASLYVLTENDQYKFSESNHLMMLNDFPIETKNVYIPHGRAYTKK